MMPEVIINNQEAESLNLSIFVNINGISFFTYKPVNFKASRIYRSTFSRPQKVENLHSLIYDEFKIHNIFNMRILTEYFWVVFIGVKFQFLPLLLKG